MRFVHVTDTFLPKIGGAEIAIDQLVRALIAGGDECAVLAQRPRGMKAEISTPYPLRRFANPRSSLWAGWWIKRRLSSLIQQFGRPDALIGHHAFPPGYACVNFGLRHDIPTIVYPRGGDIYEVSRFRRKKHAWRKLTWSLANASAVVCASAAMETLVREIIPATSQRVVRIPNGVNLDDLRQESSVSRFNADGGLANPFILALGRMIRRKGFHLLIDAFAALPKSDWRLVIAGDGRELPNLQLHAKPLGDRIVFTGLVEGADKRWLLQHCRFMAAPSLEESFGNVALEAMACGKPVVASNASGFVEIVRERMNGRLVNVGDVTQLRDILAEMMRSELSAMRRSALETAGEFSWQSIASQYRTLASEIIQHNHR